MDLTLMKLLNEYVKNANEVANQMLRDFNATSKKDFLIKKTLFMNGELEIKSINKYIFHGRGCRVLSENGDIIIDWDFGYGDYWVGINDWLFYQYLFNKRCSIKDTYTYESIKEEMSMMVEQGKLYKKYDLYYIL